MDSGGSLLLMRVVLVVVLCLLQCSQASDNQLTLHKMALPVGATQDCLEETLALPPGLTLSPAFFCSLQCQKNPACTAVCPKVNSCLLLNLMIAPPGGKAALNAPCYVPSRSTGASHGPDLARHKPVTDPGTWDGKYVPGYTTVSGARCEKKYTDCFCSSYVTTPYFKVDLGASLQVATVVVTASKFYPDYFQDVDIHVGDVGDDSDALLTSYSSQEPAPGEVLTLKGSATIKGRYVSLYRQGGLLSNSLCFCLIQVYGQ